MGWRDGGTTSLLTEQAALIDKYGCSKGEPGSCQSERTPRTHHGVFKHTDIWTTETLPSEILRNAWRGAGSPIFEPMEGKKSPRRFRGTRSGPTVLRSHLLLAEVRLKSQTDGEISAFGTM